MFAITEAVSKWRQYLLGRRFIIITDQQSLKSLTNQTIQTQEQQKWLTKLVGFDFQIVYWPGKQNGAADALSRNFEEAYMTIFVTSLELEQELRQLNANHPELLAIQQAKQRLEENFVDYQLKEGLLFYKGQIVIPTDSPLRHKLMFEFHATSIGGHARVAQTYHQLASNFFWKHMHKDV